MKASDLIKMLQDAECDGDIEIKIFDADAGENMPVTGMTHTAEEVRLCSDDMNN